MPPVRPHAPIHVVTPVTRESEIFLDIKKKTRLRCYISVLSEHFAILIQCSCSAGCSLSGSRENAHFMAHESVDSLNRNLNMNLLIKTAALCCIP